MLTLHTWTTPNGRKPAILLAELNLPYQLVRVDITKDEQKDPSYLAINPNGKIPTLVDDGFAVFESGAILTYLAEKHGALLPKDTRGRAEVLAWVFWQVGGPGPFFGQLHHFKDEEPREEKAYEHFLEEAKRLASVLDGRMAGRTWVCDAYSIADIAIYPWFQAASELMPEALEGTKNLASWMKRMEERPAVQLGMKLEQAER